MITMQQLKRLRSDPGLTPNERSLMDTMEAYRRALLAERAYHRNNTGENAQLRKAALAALPNGWNKDEDPWVLDENQQWRLLSEVKR